MGLLKHVYLIINKYNKYLQDCDLNNQVRQFKKLSLEL